MANSPQAKKRARQADKRAEHNTSLHSRMRTAIKNFLHGCSNPESDVSGLFAIAVKVIDCTASKGIIHKNKAARLKSRLNKRCKAQLTQA